jgi:hypothetical protein
LPWKKFKHGVPCLNKSLTKNNPPSYLFDKRGNAGVFAKGERAKKKGERALVFARSPKPRGGKVMPKTMKGWVMFGAAVLLVVVVVKRVPQINQFVGL